MDPNYTSNFTKITFKKKILSELINLSIVVSITLLLFSFVGKKVITKKIGLEYIKNINVIYQNLADEKQLKTYTSKNYGFLDLDEDVFISNYTTDNNVEKEVAYEKYLEARLNLLEEIRKIDDFKVNNNKFNTIYYLTFGVIVFIVLFVFEFLIIIFIGKSKNIGMLLTKQSIVNFGNNNYPNKFKLILRLFVMFFIEHMLFRLFFNNVYFVILILLNLMFIVTSRNKIFIHDIFSLTKEINDNYIGLIE